MKTGAPAFSLFSCIIYLFLFTSLVTMSLSFSLFFMRNVYRLSTNCTHLMNIYIAHDLIMKDLSTAPTAMHNWRHSSPARLLWYTNNKTAISWYQENNYLV